MLLCNTNVVGQDEISFIRVRDKQISQTGGNKQQPLPERHEWLIDCADYIVFPGLINSHDHLDFNLFPQTGNKVYDNYQEWGKDIHQQNREAINAVLSIPSALRVQWGLYKNLLNGVTTVVNHGAKLSLPIQLITALQDSYPLHSVAFEKNWQWKLNSPFRKNKAFVIHIGEGTDSLSRKEIALLIRWNLLKRKIIGVHGVAMTPKQATAFDALIWCPASNYFLFKKTAPIDLIKEQTTILFGTDSTLTADWNLWQQLRCARSEAVLNDLELFQALTVSPARIWELAQKGKIEENYDADIVVAKPKNTQQIWNAFYSLDPADIVMVLHEGMPVFVDGSIYSQMEREKFNRANFYAIEVNGVLKYVKGDLPSLIQKIRKYYPLEEFPVAYS